MVLQDTFAALVDLRSRLQSHPARTPMMAKIRCAAEKGIGMFISKLAGADSCWIGQI